MVNNRNLFEGYACGGPNEPCIAPANLPYLRINQPATRDMTARAVARAFFPGSAGYQNCPVGSLDPARPVSPTPTPQRDQQGSAFNAILKLFGAKR
jgi:hypothetical protein